MIARIWRGVVAGADGDEYEAYIERTGFAEYGAAPGNRGAWLLRREVGDRTEFLTVSLWESLDAVKGFAGEEYETAVYYPEDERYLVEREDAVAHYEVAREIDRGAG